MTLTAPLMLVGLAVLPVLAAVYWLRSRSRRMVVSSLILFANQRRARQGGRILQRMQTPVTFFLELLAMALIALAAAGPAMRTADVARPLVVVLDNSYSMQAGGGGDSPRQRAESALMAELRRGSYQVRFVLAGARPVLLGEPVRSVDEATRALEPWRCGEAQAALAEAMAMAAELGGPTARVLVLTDQPPSWPIEGGQVQWWAFGRPAGNVAITAAARTGMEDRQRVLLEVANLSSSPTAAELKLEGAGLAETRAVNLDAGQHSQIILDLNPQAGPLRAYIGQDPLDIDNQVILLPPPDRPLRTSVQLPQGPLREAALRALAATGRVLVSDERPEMVISNRPAAPNDAAWHLQISSAGQAEAYAGPYVIDRAHPLADGLSLAGVIWSVGSDYSPPGSPVVTLGNKVLLAVSEGAGGARRLALAIDAAASNLQDSPDWPILISNVVGWRLASLGLTERNVRLGVGMTLALPPDAAEAEWTAPGRPVARLPVHQGQLEIIANAVGLHALTWPGGSIEFACNALSPRESDLSACRSGRWGSWNESPLHRDALLPLAWVAAVLALAAMVLHLAVISRAGGGRGV